MIKLVPYSDSNSPVSISTIAAHFWFSKPAGISGGFMEVSFYNDTGSGPVKIFILFFYIYINLFIYLFIQI